MKSQIALGLIIWSALVANANGQSTARGVSILDVETSKPSRDASAIDTEPESFNMAGIDESVVSQFSIAWQSSGLGTSNTEGLVLIFRKANGSYLALSQGATNENRKFTFRWQQSIIAIVHTHRDGDDPKPSPQDKFVADKFGVPISTITRRGMFIYHPSTKKTSKVVNGLDWLQAGKFREITENHVFSKAL